MSIINNGLLLASGADAATTYQISRSIRLNAPDSAYFSRTPSSAGNRRTWTFSCWIKRSALTAARQTIFRVNTPVETHLSFAESAQGNPECLMLYSGGSLYLLTTPVFRDVSAWYHIVAVVDTTDGTSSNRAKLYVNGTQITTFNTATYPSQNFDTGLNTTNIHYIGASGNAGEYLSAYLADIYFLDGTATTPSTFAETDAVTGQWVPKTPTGISYGTNGFRLTFSDNSGTTSTTLGKDAAGSNNWSPNNFSVASGSGNDSLVDSPTSYGTDTGAGGEVRGNYATLNPLNSRNQTTLANGNLDAGPNSTNNGTAHAAFSTIGVDSGKWYCEATVISGGSSSNIMVGISDITQLAGNVFDFYSRGYGYRNDALKINNNSGSSYGATYTNNDVIGIALDLTAGTLVFYKNGSSQGTAFSGISSSYVYHFACFVRNTDDKVAWNFGQRAFAYTAPSGFKALCDTNFTAPTIALPNTVMDVKLYTGTAATQSITGLGFSPDFVWIKNRNGTAAHHVFDIVRGATKRLITNGTQDDSYNAYDSLTSFDTSGFTLGADTSTGCVNNPSGATYVAWAWDAGTSTVTNTQGSITSSVRANASAGFSIVTYQANAPNNTIGHGLGVRPEFVITKARTRNDNWLVYHSALGVDKWLHLNITAAAITTSGIWGTSGNWTSTTFGVSTNGIEGNNYGSNDFVAYCFAPVAGYSSFGSYTGNGGSQFLYLGFKPRFWMHKRTDTAGSWMIVDSARSSYNVAQDQLYANLSNADSQYGGSGIIDFVSNGVVLRSTGGDVNASGASFVYMAWAESPFQYARAR